MLLAVVVLAWTAYLVYAGFRTATDLRDAERAMDRLQQAVTDGDAAAREDALADLRDSASAARDRTDGLLWSAGTKVPAIGDDLAGVETLSASIDVLATYGLEPLLESADALDDIVGDGRVDPEAIERLQPRIGTMAEAIRTAANEVAGVDTSGFLGPFRDRYDDYRDRVTGLVDAADSAELVADTLPPMLGADGPRNYLFVFQNNAETRSTGGVPGSWALIHADDGELTIEQQGSPADFPRTKPSIVPLTDAEIAVFGAQYGQYFQNPGFAPGFPRAAEIFRAHWDARFPDVPLDGVVALDPVGMSYLIPGTGPLDTGPVTLTADNVVEIVLSTVYDVAEPPEQDEFFQLVARTFFTAATHDLASPVDFAKGLAQAATEGRLLVAPFDREDADRLAGTRVLGELPGDDGRTPHVDVGINDSTGSKMSYYLRHDLEVEATGCADGVQQLKATMTLEQTISHAEAKKLSPYVNGGGVYGIDPGAQLVTLFVYGPYGGTVDDVLIDGVDVFEDFDPDEYLTEMDGRPVVAVLPYLDDAEQAVVTWTMTTGTGQTDDAQVWSTPGLTAGKPGRTVPTAC